MNQSFLVQILGHSVSAAATITSEGRTSQFELRLDGRLLGSSGSLELARQRVLDVATELIKSEIDGQLARQIEVTA